MARAQIEAHGGVVEKFIGDAVVGVFGVPAAHEDDPERAVRAGLRIVEGAEELEAIGGAPLRLRVGINTGEALVRLGATPGSGERLLAGDAINTASRMQSVAPEMGVAVGLATFEATAVVFDYEELRAGDAEGEGRAGAGLPREGSAGPVRDRSDPDARHAVRRPRDRPGAVEGHLRQDGRGELGAAGDGGRRAGARQEPARGRAVRLHRCPAGSGHLAAGPLPALRGGDHVLGAGRDPEGARRDPGVRPAPGRRRTKLDAVLPEGPEREWFRQRLLPLLGIEATSSAEREELFTAWRRFLELIAEERPTVLVFEDLHWADEAMLAFLEHLADLAEGVPLLLVGTARPELYERHPDYAAGLRNANTINLAPLSQEETARLVSALLEATVLPAELQQPILERAGGNPLVRRGVRPAAEGPGPARPEGLELGAAGGRGGAVPGVGAGADRRPPGHAGAGGEVDARRRGGDRQGVLGRGRRRDGRPRPAAGHRPRCGSCRGRSSCGRRGSRRWRARPSTPSGTSSPATSPTSQLPRASRASRHVAAAAWIESKAPDRVEDLADVLAYHYATALDLARAAGQTEQAAELEAPALRFLGAGRGARARPGHRGRPRELRAGAGADARPDIPDGPRRSPASARPPCMPAAPAEAGEALEEAITSFRARGDLRRPRPARWPRSVRCSTGREIRAGRTCPPRRWPCWSRCPRAPSSSWRSPSSRAPKRSQGRHDDGVRLRRQALALAEELGLPRPARALGYRGMARCELGDPGGLQDMRDAITLATEAGQGREAAVLYGNLGESLWAFEGAGAALEVMRAGIGFAQTRGLTEIVDFITGSTLDPARRPRRVRRGARGRLGDSPLAWRARTHSTAWLRRAAQARVLTVRGQAAEALGSLDWLESTSRRGRRTGVRRDRPRLCHARARRRRTGRSGRRSARRDRGHPRGPRDPVLHRSTSRRWCARPWRSATGSSPSVSSTGQEPRYPYAEHALVAVNAALAEARGDLRRRRRRLRRGRRRWQRFGVILEQAYALLGQGRCLTALGRPAEATSALQQAHEIFDALRAAPALAEIDGLLRQAPQLSA